VDHCRVAVKTAIRDRVGEALRCSAGIASNRLLAKLACDTQKPDGLVILEPKDLPQSILHLKPEDIPGIGPNMLTRLNRAGILDMTQLWAADAQRLRKVWGGIVGVRFHAQLHGADIEPPPTAKRSISHQHVLSPEERTIERATPIIRQLLVRLAHRLRTEGFYCRRLSVDIKWIQDHGQYADEIRLNETRDTQFLFDNLMRRVLRNKR
jgi:DNA polymerase-4